MRGYYAIVTGMCARKDVNSNLIVKVCAFLCSLFFHHLCFGFDEMIHHSVLLTRRFTIYVVMYVYIGSNDIKALTEI